jgi:glycosyltransferase involved in cell wall biosynthesis
MDEGVIGTMRIGFDGSCLANRRGFGRFTRQTLAALAEADHPHEIIVFVDRPSDASVEIAERFQRIVVDVGQAPTQAASASGRRRIGDMLAMGKAVARAKLDLMFFPATYSFFPVWNVPRVVVTMHDTLALTLAPLVFPTWQGRLAWKLKEHLASRWADRIVTVSEASRRELLAWFRLPERKVSLMTEGPDPVFRPLGDGPHSASVLRRYGVEPGSKFLLYVGGLSPHKNLPRLIEAFASASAHEVSLVLVGDTGDVFHTHVPILREAVARFGLENRVIFTGFVPDDDLVYLYNRAYALVQPSLMEGFGLPPVEAMACGTPVLASTAGSLPEVVGEAGKFFDPLDVPAMAATLTELVGNPTERNVLARAALARSARFTWKEAARLLLACFDELDSTRKQSAKPWTPACASHTSGPRFRSDRRHVDDHAARKDRSHS